MKDKKELHSPTSRCMYDLIQLSVAPESECGAAHAGTQYSSRCILGLNPSLLSQYLCQKTTFCRIWPLSFFYWDNNDGLKPSTLYRVYSTCRRSPNKRRTVFCMSKSAARVGTQYSLLCTWLEPVVVVPIKYTVFSFRTHAGSEYS